MVNSIALSLSLVVLSSSFASGLKCSAKKSSAVVYPTISSFSYPEVVPTPSSASSGVVVVPSYYVPSSSSQINSYVTVAPSSTGLSSSLVEPSSSKQINSYVTVNPSTSFVSSDVVKSSSSVATESISKAYPTSSQAVSTTSSTPQPSYTNPPTSGNNLFKGLTYSPYNAEGCKSKAQVYSEVSNLIKYTNQIRLYGTDCNQIEFVLQTLVDLKSECRLLLGIWVRDGEQRFQKELTDVITTLKNPTYTNYVIGVTVGNEELLNNQSESNLIEKISIVKTKLQQNSCNVPVSTVEVFNKWTQNLAQVSTVVYANIYAFFTPANSSKDISTAVQGTLDEINKLKVKFGKDVVVSETGWATQGTSSGVTFLPATLQNQCTFLNQFLCKAKKANLNYFILEAYDAKWKKGDSCEQNFGIFDASHSLKCSNVQSC